jgi:hypothetical protein
MEVTTFNAFANSWVIDSTQEWKSAAKYVNVFQLS